MRWTYCAALSLAAIGLLAAAQETHNIVWNPEKGAKTKFLIEMSAEMDFGSGPMPLQANLTIENEIKEIKGDHITMLTLMTKHELMLAGQDVTEMMPGAEFLTAPIIRTYSKRGALLVSDSKSALDNPRFEQLRVISFPESAVKIGDTWTNEHKGDKDKSVPPSRGKFTLDGVEDLDGKSAFRIKFSFSELEGEKPMGAIGTIWIDKATGDLVKTDADINDAQFVEQMPPTNFKMKIRRI